MRRAFVLLVCLACLSSACAARTASSPQPPSPSAPAAAGDRLQQALAALFRSPDTGRVQWGVHIVSLGDGAVLYSQDAARFMVPASNQKILTAAAAAERLGWDFRFTTRLLTTGTIDADGILGGDLIIVGNGDPTINPRHATRWSVFDAWAETLRNRGIRVIRGHVIGDDNAFAEPGWGVGWAWDNLQYGYGAPVSALQYNENQIEVQVGPGMAPGARAIISTSPAGSGMIVDDGVETAAAGAPSTVDIARVPGTPLLQVSGRIAADAKPVTITASVDNPTRLYLNAFREALGRHGIFVGGSMVDIDDARTAPEMSTATEVIVDRSPPLSEIVDVMMKWSRNIYAETLLYALTPAGQQAGSGPGLEAMRETLVTIGLARDEYLPRDGSGLSRYDYVSAEALTRLLTAIWSNPRLLEPFRASLPVAGVSGSLADRMKGTPAESRVWAKTGTLSNVRSLSGYLTTAAGEPIVFSILANNYPLATADIDAIVEKALVAVVTATR